MSLRPSARDWRLAALDLVRCFQSWHVWLLLGLSDVRLRYKRSRFGQFWITFSMAIFVAGIGVVYGILFRMNVREYIPYLAVNMTVWGLISGSIADGTSTFIEAGTYIRQEALPKTAFVMRILVRNLVAFAHNLLIIPVVFLLFLFAPSPVALLAIPGLALIIVATFLSTLALGILCTRYRDLPQIVSNLMQLAFFVTPIMWHVEQLGDHARLLLLLNPFASFLRIVSEPMQGRVPSLATYGIVVGFLVLLFLIAWPLFAKFRARIVYWL